MLFQVLSIDSWEKFILSCIWSKFKYEKKLYLRLFKIAANILNWMSTSSYSSYLSWKGFTFPAIYDSSKWKFCELDMKMVMMKIFPILLKFCHKLVLREGVFGTAASLIPYFAIVKL